MKGHFYKPHCKCVDSKGNSKKTKKCSCGARWAFIIDVGIDPGTGKRKQKKKGGFNSKKEAQEAAALLLAELSRGEYIEEKNITFEQFAQEWINIYQSTGNVKISTIRIRQHEISRLLPYFAKLKMKDITKKLYQDALLDLKKQGYADNTIDGIHRTGRMIFKKAVEQKIIKSDPTEFAVVPKTQKTVEDLENEIEIPKYMEKEELALFLETAKKYGLDKDYVVFLTLAYTGMRVGELCALKWKDIDFVEKTISITKTYYNPKLNIKNYQLLTPKTEASRRVIDVDEIVIKALMKHKSEQNKIRVRYRDIYHDQDFVFTKNKPFLGYPEYPKLIQNRMERLLKIAGLNPELTPHSLRHTHTSLLAEAGVSLEQIMARLGHRDDETTRNIYLHVTKPKKKEASQKFAQLMKSLSS